MKMDDKEMGCEVLDWIHLAQELSHWLSLENSVMNLGIP
jgi:hypothetical protein